MNIAIFIVDLTSSSSKEILFVGFVNAIYLIDFVFIGEGAYS